MVDLNVMQYETSLRNIKLKPFNKVIEDMSITLLEEIIEPINLGYRTIILEGTEWKPYIQSERFILRYLNENILYKYDFNIQEFLSETIKTKSLFGKKKEKFRLKVCIINVQTDPPQYTEHEEERNEEESSEENVSDSGDIQSDHHRELSEDNLSFDNGLIDYDLD